MNMKNILGNRLSSRNKFSIWEHAKPVPTIIHESDVTICGVQMKRYEVTVTTETTPLSEFFVNKTNLGKVKLAHL